MWKLKGLELFDRRRSVSGAWSWWGGGGVRIRVGGVILLGIGTRGLVWFEGVRFGRSD